MANVRDFRTRIRSVKSTQQITRAMYLVAAAKMRRAQERIVTARPYARKMLEVLSSLAARAGADKHPLLARRAEERVIVVVISADKGLCGSFNMMPCGARSSRISRSFPTLCVAMTSFGPIAFNGR